VRAVLALLVVVLAGCGVPHDLAKQAEEVSSVAAEGSLLAHDAAEGDTTGTFTREHAKALRKQLRELEPAIENADLAQLAAKVDEILGVLADRPGDRDLAATFERVLEHHARAAEGLAG
jgi:hypothetical protein